MARKYLLSLLTAALVTISLAPGTNAAAAVARPGKVHAQWRAAGVHPAIVARVPLVEAQTAAATAPTLPAQYFGMHVLHLQFGTAWPSVRFGTWRIWDAGVDWAQLQPTASTYNWQALDTYIALAKQQGMDVILELGQTPKWASTEPTSVTGGLTAPPVSNTLWTNYVSAVATRYKGKIAYYEVWNEVNTTNYWDGTPAQMVQLVTLASKAIKSIDPAAKIISPSITNISPSALAYLQNLLDLGMGSSVDAIGIHFYIPGKTPEALIPTAQSVQALMKQYKLTNKPLINTEFGWAPPNLFNTVDDQSGYMMRAMLVGWSAGMQRFMWYAWDNSNFVTVTMTQPDFKTPTMVAKAYTTLQAWTVNKEVSACVAASTVWSCDITDTSGDHSRIYWDTAGAGTVTPSLTWTPAHAVDMYGNVTAYTGGSLAISAHPILIKE